MKLRKGISAALFLAMVCTIMTPSAFAFGAEQATQETAPVEEVYLQPTQISENVYRFESDGVEIIVTWEPGEPSEMTRAVNGNRSYSMRLNAGNIGTVSSSLDTTHGVVKVYFSISMSPTGDTFYGYTLEGTGKYAWMDIPVSSSGTASFDIGSTRPIYMALKNVSSRTISYSGEYGFEKP